MADKHSDYSTIISGVSIDREILNHCQCGWDFMWDPLFIWTISWKDVSFLHLIDSLIVVQHYKTSILVTMH